MYEVTKPQSPAQLGGRILFQAGEFQRFGLEATYLDLDISSGDAFHERYVVLGVVLEMTLFDNFLLGIGTVGYVGLGDTDGKPFGIVTNLGWEPAWKTTVLPFVTLRTEWVFDDVVFSVLSLSVGITFQI